jgi:hypothetical protein
MGWLRHPKTLQEKRENADPEVKGFVRAKRKPKKLPSEYDDEMRTGGRKPRYKDHRRGLI